MRVGVGEARCAGAADGAADLWLGIGPAARREAERGTFDPTYLVYSVGKLMLQKLRRDVEAKQGDAFSLKSFHDALLKQGNATFAVHRRLMLGDGGGALLE